MTTAQQNAMHILELAANDWKLKASQAAAPDQETLFADDDELKQLREDFEDNWFEIQELENKGDLIQAQIKERITELQAKAPTALEDTDETRDTAEEARHIYKNAVGYAEVLGCDVAAHKKALKAGVKA